MLTAKEFFVYGMKLIGLYLIITGLSNFISLFPIYPTPPGTVGLFLLAMLALQIGAGLYFFFGGKYVVDLVFRTSPHEK